MCVQTGTATGTSSRTLIRRLTAEGWHLISIKGSHHKYRKGAQTVIVPHPKKNLPLGAWRGIVRMAGLTEGEPS